MIRSMIVSYDISKNKLRKRVHKILQQWRIGGQKSVHECRLSQRDAEELFLQMNSVVDQKTDKVLMVWLDNHRKMFAYGCGNTLIQQKTWHIAH